ncbi:hypothetical protein I6A60_26640 [Frankia sp. AgB1.9]|uniref:hypothetical protein n=1 Tax=unclassified Frankia TaxID=2632575 RepID=UPI00193122F4|nr:hypothetical protein [Frankia sp. AgW1.1]MBL7551412.1 hypothetical protein [Frankia sp. AgB1.9]MBL7622664.1 hypothetical protein [Frankia sp. AgB1.8]
MPWFAWPQVETARTWQWQRLARPADREYLAEALQEPDETAFPGAGELAGVTVAEIIGESRQKISAADVVCGGQGSVDGKRPQVEHITFITFWSP